MTAGWLQSIASDELDVARVALQQVLCERGAGDLCAMDCVEQAERRLRESPLRVLVLAQPRRGVWQQQDSERLHRASPLTRLIGVHGSWCEGWQRSGHPWSGVEQLYWHQAPGVWRVLLSRPAPPRTAAGPLDSDLWDSDLWDGDLSDGDLSNGGPWPSASGVVVVSAPAVARDSLRTAFEPLGCQVISIDDLQDEPSVAAVWDGDIRHQADRRRLEQLAQRCPDARRIALTLAPRLDDWRQLESLAEVILTKPFPLAALHAAIAGPVRPWAS